MRLENVELYMGPREAGAPDDLKQVIIDFIRGAEKRLEIAVQELEDEDIARAIIERRREKVQVWLVIEADYLREKRLRRNPFVPDGSTRRIVAFTMRYCGQVFRYEPTSIPKYSTRSSS